MKTLAQVLLSSATATATAGDWLVSKIVTGGTIQVTLELELTAVNTTGSSPAAGKNALCVRVGDVWYLIGVW